MECEMLPEIGAETILCVRDNECPTSDHKLFLFIVLGQIDPPADFLFAFYNVCQDVCGIEFSCFFSPTHILRVQRLLSFFFFLLQKRDI